MTLERMPNKPSQRDNFKLAPVASLLTLASLKIAPAWGVIFLGAFIARIQIQGKKQRRIYFNSIYVGQKFKRQR